MLGFLLPLIVISLQSFRVPNEIRNVGNENVLRYLQLSKIEALVLASSLSER